MKHYLSELTDVFRELSADENGLSSAEAEKRLAANGANKLDDPPGEPLWKKFIKQFGE